MKKPNQLSIHIGEDYATGYLGDDAIFTRTYPNERIERQLNKVAARYNMLEELAEAAFKFVKGGWEGLPTCTYQEFEALVATVRKAREA